MHRKTNSCPIQTIDPMLMIQSYAFGEIRISGRLFRHDIKIIRSRVMPHWRRQTGHLVSLDDIADMIHAAPDILIFGTGSAGRMKIDDDLEKHLKKKNIRLMARPTDQAVDLFNRLIREGQNIAAGFHLTC
jgi:hypothetical protein